MGKNIKQEEKNQQDKKKHKKGNGFNKNRDQTSILRKCVDSCRTQKIVTSNSTSAKDLIKMLSFLILRLVFFCSFFISCAVLLLFWFITFVPRSYVYVANTSSVPYKMLSILL